MSPGNQKRPVTNAQTTVTLRVEEEETPKALEQKCWTE